MIGGLEGQMAMSMGKPKTTTKEILGRLFLLACLLLALDHFGVIHLPDHNNTGEECAAMWEEAGPPSDHPEDRSAFISSCSEVGWPLDAKAERWTTHACEAEQGCLEARRKEQAEAAKSYARWYTTYG